MSVIEQLIPAGSWTVDGVHSSVRFEIEHMGLSTFGAGFTDYDARLVADADGVQLRGAVRVESLDVRDDGLRPHVLAPDFLDLERHPELSFRSTAVRAEGDDVVVRGELTIRGATVPVEGRGSITGPVVDPSGSERLALSLTAIIDRTEFGLGWQMDLPGGGRALADDVKLVVSLELVKED